MKSGKKLFPVLVVSLLLVGSGFLFANGQEEKAGPEEAASQEVAFPTQDVRMIVAYKPGGQSDMFARKISSVIEQNKLLSQPVVVTNIAGAGTRDALRTVMNADPDGHTILMHHTAMLTMRSLNLLPWDYTEFTPISQVATAPMVVVVRADSPWQDMEELLADANSRPGEISFALQGIGGNGHFITEMILQEAGAEFNRIGYQGGADSLAAQLGGHVDVRISSLLETIPYVQSGDFRILAVSSEERLDELPDVKTLNEQGFDIVFYIRNGIFGPTNIPEPVLSKLENVLKQVVDSQEFKTFMAENFTTPAFLDSEGYTAAFQKDWEKISETARGIELE